MLLSTLYALLGVASCAAAGSLSATKAQSQATIPQAYIVQLDGSTASLSKRGLTPRAVLDNVMTQLTKSGISYGVRRTFDSNPNIFHGLSINVSSSVSMADIAALSGVQNVWPVRRFARPQTIVPASTDGAGAFPIVPPVSASALAATLLDPTTLTKRHGLAKRQRVSPFDLYGAHIQTGVNVTHRALQLGAGVKIALIDTGVDYTNPLLGGCFGAGCHISFGYDLVGDNYGTTGVAVPDADPLDTCDGHGTHTLGVIGALPNIYGFSGVAYNADFGMYRIFGCTGSAGEDIVMSAYMMALAAGAQVINLSLSAPAGYTGTTPTEILIEAAALNGVVTTSIAGNDRAEGLFFAEEPATTVNAFSVGSVDVKYLPAYNATLGDGSYVPYLSTLPLALSGTYPVFFTTTDASNTMDACSALPAGTPDLTNYVTVVQRGTCTFVVKFQNIYNAGGRIVLVIDSAGSTSTVYLTNQGVALTAVATLTRPYGLQLLAKYVANGNSLTMVFASKTQAGAVLDPITGGLPSTFTNWGPSSDLFGVPTLSAPGGNIISTLPLSQGGIGISSGTSESSPFIAGAAAVLKAARASENLTPIQIRSLLSTTSVVAPLTIGGTLPANVALVGAGVVQLDLAVAAKTLISPYQLLLNDTTYSTRTFRMLLTNRDTVTLTYSLSSSAAAANGVYANGGNILPATTPPLLTPTQAAVVTFASNNIIVPPGRTLSVAVTITPPVFSAADAARFPVYSGFVTVTSSSKQIFNVPYMGLAGSAFNMPVFDTTDTLIPFKYPLILDPNSGNPQASDGGVYTKANGPVIFLRLAGPTRLVTVDVVAAATTFTGTIPTNNNAGAPSRLAKRAGRRALVSETRTSGRWLTNTNLSRDYAVNFPGYSDNEIQFSGTVMSASGASSSLQTGVAYRFLVRGLKNTGDPSYEDQYESWLSPSWTFSA